MFSFRSRPLYLLNRMQDWSQCQYRRFRHEKMRITAYIRNTMPQSGDPTRPVPSTDSHFIMHWDWLHPSSSQLCKYNDKPQHTVLKQVPINTCCIVQTKIVSSEGGILTFNPNFWQQSNVNCCVFPGKVILQTQTRVFGARLPSGLVLALLLFDIVLPISIRDFNCFLFL